MHVNASMSTYEVSRIKICSDVNDSRNILERYMSIIFILFYLKSVCLYHERLVGNGAWRPAHPINVKC